MDKKLQRYDRQLRLWHSHGQEALENSRVCLIHASATGAEILKNMVLPGIGSFTIVDSAKITLRDIGNNFFINSNQVGLSRSRCVTESLRELNSDVSGFHIEEDLGPLLQNNPEFLRDFSLVIATQLTEPEVLLLGRACWSQNIPLIIAKTYGLFGYFRIALPEHTIVESYLEKNPDLRLDCPFDTLKDYVEKISPISLMSNSEKSSLPYVVILLKFLSSWMEKFPIPKTPEEKKQFRQFILKDYVDKENFQEAMGSIFRLFNCTKVPKEVELLFNDNQCLNLSPSSNNFWILVRAIKDFVQNEGNGQLPLTSAFPDMKADTENYNILRNIYKEKSDADLKFVTSHVRQILTELELPFDRINPTEIKTACKNARNLRALRYRSIDDEYSVENCRKDYITHLLLDPSEDILFYVILRAIDQFKEVHKRYPGVYNEEYEVDIKLLKKCVLKLLSQWGFSATYCMDDAVQEMVRAGSSELHNIASLQGGLVAQEAIKILTRQFVPVNNTCIFNGMKSTISIYEL